MNVVAHREAVIVSEGKRRQRRWHDAATSPANSLDLGAVNARLRGCSPEEIVRWALSLKLRTVVTTSMGINAGATLHAVASVDASIPVIWVDSGFNLRDTYQVAEELEARLQLNLHVYSPSMTAERISVRLGGVPLPDEPEKHAWFTQVVKLDPFQRALNELRPEVWITGIRRDETEHRRQLDIVSVDKRGLIKVAPFFEQTAADVEAYMARHQLPSCRHYFDPTKVDAGRECGLHT